jgi:Ca-activated chloride channel family protein
MPIQKTRTRRLRGRVGAAATMLAVLLPIIAILAGFAINFAYMQLVRTETFVAADAVTRAAARTYALTGDLAKAKSQAQTAATNNAGVSSKLTLQDKDFILGTSVRSSTTGRYTFTPGGTNTNALKVKVDRSVGSANGSVPLLFPNILGTSNFAFSKESVSTLVDVDIAFVVDRSGSMAYAANEKAAFPPLPASAPVGWWFGNAAPPSSRWRDLASASSVFLKQLESASFSAQVALVSYGDTAFLDQKMTSSFASINTALDKYTKKLDSAATNIGNGLQIGESALGDGRAYASKVVVLMTDGIRTAGPDPIPIADALGKKGIIVFTVTFSNEADKATMLKVAQAGLGLHFHADSGSALTAVFEQIVKTLPTVLTQ